MERPIIYLDMDGVIADFVGGVLKMCNLPTDAPEVVNWEKGNYSVHHPTGYVEEKDLWRDIDAIGEDFWVNLNPYPWMLELYTELVRLGDVYFLTSPAVHPCSHSGKIKWLHNYFGALCRNYILTKHKHLLSKPNAILVDDSDMNCAMFGSHGGHSVLFPQIWNAHPEGTAYPLTDDDDPGWIVRVVIDDVKQRIERMEAET